MKNAFRKLTFSVLAVVMLLSLVACSNTSSTGASTSDEQATAATTSDSSDGITLYYSSYKSEWDETFQKVFNQFMEDHPEVTAIETEYMSSGDYWGDLNTKLASGTLPNIGFIRLGALVETWQDHLVAINDTDVQSTHDEMYWEDMCIGDNCYGCIFNYEYAGILYDMEYLEQVGYTEDMIPRTVSEFVTLCDKLDAAGLLKVVSAWGPGNDFCWYGHLGSIPFVLSGDAKNYYETISTPGYDLVNDEYWNKYFDFIDLMDTYNQDDPLSLDVSPCRMNEYNDEYAIVMIEGSWLDSQAASVDPTWPEHMILGPFLVSDDTSENYMAMHPVSLCVYEGHEGCDSQTTELAKELYEYLYCDPDVQELFASELGIVRTHSGLEYSEDNLGPLAYKAWCYQNNGGAVGMNCFWPVDEVKADWVALTQKYIAGEATREETLAALGTLFQSVS